MPSWVSKEGVWEPAHEYVVNPKAEKGKEIYDGPDREAVKVMEEEGGNLGQHYTLDMELISRVKQLGFDSIEDYLKMKQVDPKKLQAAYEKNKEKIVDHAAPSKVRAVQPQSGGDNTAPGSSIPSRKGGFGDQTV